MPLKLESLSMLGNGLTEVSLSRLTHAYNYEQDVVAKFVSRNFQNSIRKKFSLSNLKKLNLARNKIKSMPDDFFAKLNMSELRTLVLDRNPFEAATFSAATFRGAHESLVALSLNGIDFDFESRDAIRALNALENLQSLKINGNGARDVTKSSKSTAIYNHESDQLSLKSLSSLELQSNGFREFPYFLCNLENLVDLDLSSNHLSSFNLDCLLFKLRNESFYEMSKLKQLNLNNNPLKCDCQMRKVKIWLMRNYDRDLLDLIRWKCAEPFELKGN